MTEFDHYAGLFAEHGGFDIPDSFNIGLSWAINNAVTTPLMSNISVTAKSSRSAIRFSRFYKEFL